MNALPQRQALEETETASRCVLGRVRLLYRHLTFGCARVLPRFAPLIVRPGDDLTACKSRQTSQVSPGRVLSAADGANMVSCMHSREHLGTGGGGITRRTWTLRMTSTWCWWVS